MNTWLAGGLSDEQIRRALDIFGRAQIAGRKTFPMTTEAALNVSSQWPSIEMPRSIRFSSRSVAVVDGETVGRAYPFRSPQVRLYPALQPGDFGPGSHSIRIETTYTLQTRGTRFTHQVVNEPERFEVVLPGADYGLAAQSDPEIDERVEAAFRFTPSADLIELDQRDEKTTEPPPPRPLASYPLPGDRFLDLYGRAGWELTKPLPFALAFEVEYEFVDVGVKMAGPSIFIPKETKTSGRFNAYGYGRQLEELTAAGDHPFRVYLTPSEDIALQHPDCEAYWNGYVLVSPELNYRMVEREKPKPEK
jgi:hypothetical protein